MPLFVPEAFLFGFTQGLIVGPLVLYGFQEGIDPKKGFWCQLQVSFGATVVNFVYLLLATYGVAHFLQGSWIQLVLWIISSYLLTHMGLNSLRAKQAKLSLAHVKSHKLKLLDTDFFKGFLICLFNPLAIVGAFVIVGGLYASHTGGASPLSFTLSVLAGDLCAAFLIAGITFFIKHIFRPWMLQGFVRVGGMMMMAYGFYFGWVALTGFLPLVEVVLALD